MMNFIQSQQEDNKAQRAAMQRQTNQVTELIARNELSNRDRAISADRSRRHKQRVSSRNEPVGSPLGAFGDQSLITLASGPASA
eukprot:10206244-Karenia_brevis.AAC.1